jgi:hypothetical protein
MAKARFKTKDLHSAEAVIRYLTEAVESGDAKRIAEAVAATAHCIDTLLKICTDSFQVIEAMMTDARIADKLSAGQEEASK